MKGPVKSQEKLLKESYKIFNEDGGYSENVVSLQTAQELIDTAFHEGIEETSKWKNAKNELPETNESVLVKYIIEPAESYVEYFAVGQWNGHIWDIQSQLSYRIIQWQSINI